MGIKIGVHVQGLEGIEAQLKGAGPRLAKKVLRAALRSVGKLWVEEVRSRVPSDTGALRDSIAATVRLRRGPIRGSSIGTVTVGPRYEKKSAMEGKGRTENPGIYGLFVEYGLKKRQYKFTPFMRPTFDATAEEMVQKFAANLKENLASVFVPGAVSQASELQAFEDSVNDASVIVDDFEDAVGDMFDSVGSGADFVTDSIKGIGNLHVGRFF